MVEVPIGALVEDGNDSVVFVQCDTHPPVFTMRHVKVTSRFDRTAYVLSVPAAKDSDLAAGQDAQPVVPTQPLRQGERVLTSGALELKTALENKLLEVAKNEEPKDL